MMDIKGKVVVITGGAGRIGRMFVRKIAESGAVAIIADISEETSKVVRQELAVEGLANIDFRQLDITSMESAVQLIQYLHAKYGRIDALVNNAYPRNANYGRRFEDVSYNDFCDNLGSHLGGYFLMAQQFSAYFRQQGHGNIINIASIYGVMAPRFDIYAQTSMTMPIEYAAIKSAIVNLTKYLASYLKGTNIKVNCISPGGILDAQPKEFLDRYNYYAASKGMLDPADIAGTLLYLLSDLSTYVNGQNIVVDDGWSL